LTIDCNLTCQSELAIVHGPTLSGQLKKNPEQPAAFGTCRQHFLHGTTIEKGMARLRSSRLQRALRTESEPPKISEIAVAQSQPLNFDKALTQQGKSTDLPACPALGRKQG